MSKISIIVAFIAGMIFLNVAVDFINSQQYSEEHVRLDWACMDGCYNHANMNPNVHYPDVDFINDTRPDDCYKMCERQYLVQGVVPSYFQDKQHTQSSVVAGEER